MERAIARIIGSVAQVNLEAPVVPVICHATSLPDT
jgi:hypothetical protein